METASGVQAQPPAGLLAGAWLSQNSRLGSATRNRPLHQAIALSKPLIAPGLPDPLYDFRVGPRCSSKERDAETGLDYLIARYYSGAQGRFTGPDPDNAGADPSSPLSWNGYSYALNNPLAYLDPTGLGPCPIDPETGQEKVCLAGIAWDWFKRSGEEVLRKASNAASQLGDAVNRFRQSPNCVGTFVAIGRTAGGIYGAAQGATAGAILGEGLGSPSGPGASAMILGGAATFGAAGATIGYAGGGAAGTIVGNLVCSSSAGSSEGGGGVGGGTSAGSTGRATPRNLKERLAMEQVKSNPKAGAQVQLQMSDPRWPANQGWVKMRQNVNGVEIHYLKNTKTGALDDFKFIQ